MFGKCALIVCGMFAASPQLANAGVLSEMLEAASRALGRNVAGEAVEQSAKSTARQAARQVTSELAETNARRMATRSIVGIGDDGLRAASQSAGGALQLADDVAAVAGNVSAQSARRLVMMSDVIEASGKAPEIMALIAKDAAADQVVDFLWRNKGAIAGGAVLTTLLLNPEAALSAGERLGSTAIRASGEYIARPAIDGTLQHVIAPATGGTAIGAAIVIVSGALAIATAARVWSGTSRMRRAASLAAFFAKRKS